MQLTIKRREDFLSSLKNKPIALLKAIRECIHSSSNGEYPYETLTAAMIRWLTDRQQKDETVNEFMARHKHNAQIVENILGPDAVQKVVMASKEYQEETDAKVKLAMLSGGFHIWKAYTL